MANVPETSDATFTWEQFQAQVNADLRVGPGLLVAYAITLTFTRSGLISMALL